MISTCYCGKKKIDTIFPIHYLLIINVIIPVRSCDSRPDMGFADAPHGGRKQECRLTVDNDILCKQNLTMSIIHVSGGAGGSALTDRTSFIGSSIPDEIKHMIKHLKQVDKTKFRKILQGGSVNNADFQLLTHADFVFFRFN